MVRCLLKHLQEKLRVRLFNVLMYPTSLSRMEKMFNGSLQISFCWVKKTDEFNFLGFWNKNTVLSFLEHCTNLPTLLLKLRYYLCVVLTV